MKTPKIIRNSFFVSLIYGFLTLVSTNPSLANDVESSNYGCTRNQRTLFGQAAPDYCTDLDRNSGILIAPNLEVTRNPDRSITLKLKVFNTGAADGLVEVYDARGNLQDIQNIEGSVPPTDLLQNGIEILDTPRLLFFSDYSLLDPRAKLEEQSITVIIPSGGYVQITKSSNYAVLYNTIKFGLETLNSLEGDPEFLRNPLVNNYLIEFIKQYGQELKVNIFKGDLALQSAFELSNIDREELLKILGKFLGYIATVENDQPLDNPFIRSLLNVGSSVVNYGLEEAIIAKLNPALGELARYTRLMGNRLNLASKVYNLYFSYLIAGEGKGTITVRDAQSMASSSSDGIEDYQLNLEGLGPIEIGMTIEEASRAAGVRLVQGVRNGSCSSFSFPEGEGVSGTWFLATDDRIASITVNDNSIMTDAGAKIGVTEQSIISMYPNQTERGSLTISGRGHYLIVLPQNESNKNRLKFEVSNQDTRVVRMSVGKLPEINYSEGCF